MSTSKKAQKGQPEQSLQTQEQHIKDVASHTLAFFEETANTARSRLQAEANASQRSGSTNAFATTNTLTNDRAARNLASIYSDLSQELSQLANEPAIARLVLQDQDGKEQVYFIARAGTLLVRTGGALMASYRSPIGRLAALRVGSDEEVSTPAGVRAYELRERATLNPKHDHQGWDSANTVIHATGYGPLTVISLRQLLGAVAPDDADFLQTLIDESNAATNVIEGIRRSVLTKMGLRDQPLLDQIQDNIFRLRLDTRLVVLGPPGTGKTTTLIKRLGQKLDTQHLDANEQRIVASSIAGPSKHAQSWLMFTPTELLKQYVKEAFALEEIAASDERIKTWTDYRHELARKKLSVWRTDANNGPFIFRPALDPFQPSTIHNQIAWFQDFESAQSADFWEELGAHAERLTQSTDSSVVSLGRRLANIVANDAKLSEKFIVIGSMSEELQKLVNSFRSHTDDKLRSALGQMFRQDTSLLPRLMTFVATLEDGSEDIDDPDADEDEDIRKPTNRSAAIEACIRALRAQARSVASGRNLQKSTRNGRLIEFLGGRILPTENLKNIGASLQLQTAARRFLNPLPRYLTGVPRRYRRYRRIRQAEGRWYKTDGLVSTDISPLETDAVLLAMLNASRDLMKDSRISRDLEQGPFTFLKTVQNLFRTQIIVDEATDFSPIQLACMKGLCDPAANSFFACGDFNQRITSWGTRSGHELKWVLPDVVFEPINISYRHSKQLNDLAHHIALLSDEGAKKTKLPEDIVNDGVKPVLSKGLARISETAEWLSARIGEIEKITGSMPSIAVLVNDEEQVVPLAEALDAALAERSIRAIPCTRGQSVGQDNDVRVFDIQHIKGLEFEAVFFVGVDELAVRMPDLFDKYLYVGTTRAATFLGVTTNSHALPPAIASLENLFQQNWSP